MIFKIVHPMKQILMHVIIIHIVTELGQTSVSAVVYHIHMSNEKSTFLCTRMYMYRNSKIMQHYLHKRDGN
jgi:hypothetical protein